MDWFLYDNGLRHERVKKKIPFNSSILFSAAKMNFKKDPSIIKSNKLTS